MESEIQSDVQLVLKFVHSADDSAFEELARRHTPMVYRVCVRILSDPHQAEDATQATFVVLAKKAGSLNNKSNVASWLHGVARYESVDLPREGTENWERGTFAVTALVRANLKTFVEYSRDLNDSRNHSLWLGSTIAF